MEISVNSIKVLDGPLDVWNEVSKNQIGEEPVHLCDLTSVVRNYITWTKLLPRVVPFYAVKANGSVNVLRVLAALGTGFDCASKNEMESVLDIGVPRSRIIFAHTSKPISHLKYARSNGVQTMTFDNAIELYKIKATAPDAKLVIRIRYDGKSVILLGDKFGCNAELDGPELLKVARALQLEVIGVSFHVGSMCLDPLSYSKAIYQSKLLFDVAKKFGFNFTLLDIGGGFQNVEENSLQQWAPTINAALDQHFPNDNVQIIAEPGRYFVSACNTLITRIDSKRQFITNGVIEKVMYYINDGIYGSLSNLHYDTHMLVPQIRRNPKVSDQLFSTTIWGPTCDSRDMVKKDCLLPDLQIGDLVAFGRTGAYSQVVATTFNGLPLPTTRYFIEQSAMFEINCPALNAICQL